MRLSTFGMLICATFSLCVVGCGISQEKYDADMQALRMELEEARANERAGLQTEIDDLKVERTSLQKEIEALQAEMKRLASERDINAKAVEQANARLATFRSMLAKFRAMIESGTIRVKIVNNRMLVEMASAILFPSGSAKLSDEGEDALAEVARILSEIKDRNFQVAGHTDNVPISTKKFRSNWSLSSARAVAVVEHLVENGMPVTHISGAGYADTQPVASNDEEEGRAQNRRIEIVLQPNLDELPDLSSLEKMSQ